MSGPGSYAFSGRLAGIEGLRAIAAGSVLVFHGWRYGTGDDPVGLGPVSSLLLPNLALGVTLFFTLSGFLLYRPFAAAIVRGTPLPSLRRYFRNRCLRILPAYWVVLLAVGLLFQAAQVRHSRYAFGPGSLAEHPWTALADLLLVQDFMPPTVLTGIGPAWSLAVEACFYVVLPLLTLTSALLARRAGSRARRRLAALVPVVVVVACGLVGKLLAAAVVGGPIPAWNGDWHSVVERSFLTQSDLFAFGLTVAVLHVEHEDGVLRLPPWWRPAAAFGALGSLGMAGLAILAGKGATNYYAYQLLAALAFGLVLALVVLADPHHEPGRLVRLLDAPPLAAVGIASYSLFLWHEPMIRWLHLHHLTLSGPAGLLVNLVVLGAVSGALAALTYHFVERPALARKGRSRSRIETSLVGGERQAAP